MYLRLKHLALVLAGAFITATPTSARQLTPAASLERFNLAAHAATSKVRHAVGAKPKLCYTSRVEGRTTYYVFSAAGSEGFVILAADDLAPELLGYVPNGKFDSNSLPDGLKYWLSELDREISLAIENDIPLSSSTQQAPTASHAAPRKHIDPLLPSRWGQSAPYNNDCPIINGKHAYTGCVATAMAQIMYYHKYPADFDWDAMLDSYNYSSSDRSDAAVAELMHACGSSINMNYGEEGSGAPSQNVMPALFKTFNYDGTGRYCPRYAYDDNEWTDLLYAELAAGRPVYYSGATSTVGHAFVLDGYDDGLFHINWGWDGMCDGYYAVTGIDPLHPKDHGIGGSAVDEGYVSNQDCIVGIRPSVGENNAPLCVFNSGKHYLVYASNGAQTTTFPANATGTIVSTGKFVNVTNVMTDVYFGLKYVNILNNRTYYTGVEDAHFYNLNIGDGTNDFAFTTAGVPEGVYSAYPVVRSSSTGKWSEVELRHGTLTPSLNIGAKTPDVSPAELVCADFRLNVANCNEFTISTTLNDVYNVAYDEVNFFGDIALGIYDETDELVAVLSDECSTISIEDRLAFEKSYPAPLVVCATIPSSLPDGNYMLSPMALHRYSNEWACVGSYYRADDTYDMGEYHNIRLTVKGDEVYVSDEFGNGTALGTGIHSAVIQSAASRVYGIDGRPSVHSRRGSIIVGTDGSRTKRILK